MPLSMTRTAKWARENAKNVVGLRVKECVWLYTNDLTKVLVQPDDFLVGNQKEPMKIYGSPIRVHVPRSLCVRARITINKKTNEIISRGKMKTQQ